MTIDMKERLLYNIIFASAVYTNNNDLSIEIWLLKVTTHFNFQCWKATLSFVFSSFLVVTGLGTEVIQKSKMKYLLRHFKVEGDMFELLQNQVCVNFVQLTLAVPLFDSFAFSKIQGTWSLLRSSFYEVAKLFFPLRFNSINDKEKLKKFYIG